MAAQVPPSATAVSEVLVAAHPDDGHDDTSAFQEALAEARRRLDAGHATVAIRVGSGTYDLTDILFIDRSGMRLFGAGQDQTVLRFGKHLVELLERTTGAETRKKRGMTPWAFRGGLVWVQGNPTRGTFERRLITFEAGALAGETHVPLTMPQRELARTWTGKMLDFRWYGGEAWLRHQYGHNASYAAVPWHDWQLQDSTGAVRFEDAYRIVGTSATGVILDRPLRMSLPVDEPVQAGKAFARIRDVLIADLTIAMPEHYETGKGGAVDYQHLHEPGYNGIFFHGVQEGGISRVSCINTDIAVVLERSSRNVIADLSISAQGQHVGHHGVTLRYGANDNFMTHVTITSPIWHGVSVQDLATGNVLTSSVFHHGMIDCHRGMPFQNLMTDLVFHRCDGRGGGANGPYAGRGMVFWGLTFAQPAQPGMSIERWHSGAQLMLNPHQYPAGAIGAISGYPLVPENKRKPWAMPDGPKDCDVTWYEHSNLPKNIFNAVDMSLSNK